MRNVSGKRCRGNKNTHFMSNKFFFENSAVCEIMRKNILEPGRPQKTTWRMSMTWWICKAALSLSLSLKVYVILIASPRQRWVGERTSLLRYTQTACLVYFGPRLFADYWLPWIWNMTTEESKIGFWKINIYVAEKRAGWCSGYPVGMYSEGCFFIKQKCRHETFVIRCNTNTLHTKIWMRSLPSLRIWSNCSRCGFTSKCFYRIRLVVGCICSCWLARPKDCRVWIRKTN